jgi:hypothetical protein
MILPEKQLPSSLSCIGSVPFGIPKPVRIGSLSCTPTSSRKGTIYYIYEGGRGA